MTDDLCDETEQRWVIHQVIFVVDSCDAERFEEARGEIQVRAWVGPRLQFVLFDDAGE